MSDYTKQVGGTHYENLAIDPYEFAMANDLGGVELNIIKYMRWREKGGIEDLRKCRNSIYRLQQRAGHLSAVRAGYGYRRPEITAAQYCEANRLGHLEAEVVRWVYFWSFNCNPQRLEEAAKACDRLIEHAEAEICGG